MNFGAKTLFPSLNYDPVSPGLRSAAHVMKMKLKLLTNMCLLHSPIPSGLPSNVQKWDIQAKFLPRILEELNSFVFFSGMMDNRSNRECSHK